MEEIVEKSVRQTLISLGLATDDPIEMQKDFQYIRSLRTSTESVKSKALLALVGVVVSGMAAAIWLGFKELLHR